MIDRWWHWLLDPLPTSRHDLLEDADRLAIRHERAKKIGIQSCPYCHRTSVLEVTNLESVEPEFECGSCKRIFTERQFKELTMIQKIDLGDQVLDRVTGFVGIVVAKTEWLNGCVRYNVQPPLAKKEGETEKVPDVACFDEQQLEVLVKGVVRRNPYVLSTDATPAVEPVRRTGGDQPMVAPQPTTSR